MTTPRLFIDVQHGLANRLRAMASAAVIAEQAGYELVVIWRPDHHCGCHLVDVLDYPGSIISDDMGDVCRRHASRVYNYMEIEPGAQVQAPILIDPDRDRGDIYVRSSDTLNSPLRRHMAEQQFLLSLRPVPAVMDLVGAVSHPFSISAHIRMATGRDFDHLPHEAPSNWPEHRHQELSAWRAQSHFSRFVNRIDTLIGTDPEATLFLAADLPDIYDVFAKRYADRLHILPRDLYDRSAQQLQYALADMLLLTLSRRFLGSVGSSFSDVTARLIDGRAPVERSGIDF
ncbi:MAG: hypothetical protein GY892_17710 [Shimia sp.]|nr:hypothetical protein [Shimia sp.]